MGIAVICPEADFHESTMGQARPTKFVRPDAIAINGDDVLADKSNKAKYAASFIPWNTTLRGVTWSIESGEDYAIINKQGNLIAKYVETEPDAHDVTIKVQSKFYPELSATKVVSVKAIVTRGVITTEVATTRPQKGDTFNVYGALDGEQSALLRFNLTGEASEVSLVDNLDGSCSITINSDELLTGYKVTCFNSTYTADNVAVNLPPFNDYIVIDYNKDANSAALMDVFNAHVTLEDTEIMWKSDAMKITNIGTWFKGNESITSFDELEEFPTPVGYDMFNGCPNLVHLKLPNSITSITRNAFQNCASLLDVKIPDTCTSISDGSFSYSANLKLEKLPSSLTYIGGSMNYGAFTGCTNLALKELPSGLTTIQRDVFKNCQNITISSLPIGLTELPVDAFAGCSKITISEIPNNITSIGARVFEGCTSLSRMKLPDTPPTLVNTNAFPSQVTFVVSSEAVKNAYLAASVWSSYPATHFVVE